MAAISFSSPTSMMLARSPVLGASPASPILGLPKMARVGKVRCSMEEKRISDQAKEANPSLTAINASMMMAAAAAVSSPSAMALVDERMSTEGTGLPFGLSNNLLGWILLGVFALIWSFYTVYTSTLDEDEESGLSL